MLLIMIEQRCSPYYKTFKIADSIANIENNQLQSNTNGALETQMIDAVPEVTQPSAVLHPYPVPMMRTWA